MAKLLLKVKRPCGKRRAFDFYETPKWQTAVLRHCLPISGSVFEPCVGDRSIADEFTDCLVHTNDLNPNRMAQTHFDAACPSAWTNFQRCDWVVTNPPFNKAFEILQLAHQHARKGVAMLLRLSFIEPTEKRGLWLSQTPPRQQIVLPRCSYTEDGKTDCVTTAWFIWGKGLRPGIQIVSKEVIK